MEPHTITTIGNLKPGDVFTRPGLTLTFMKVIATPFRKSKHLYECAAIQVGRNEAKPFKASTEVEYLFTALSIT